MKYFYLFLLLSLFSFIYAFDIDFNYILGNKWITEVSSAIDDTQDDYSILMEFNTDDNKVYLKYIEVDETYSITLNYDITGDVLIMFLDEPRQPAYIIKNKKKWRIISPMAITSVFTPLKKYKE